MRFLFINQYYAPDYAATAQQLSDLCESLVQRGHDVHVLTSRSLYDGREMDLASEEEIKGVKVHRVGTACCKRDRLRQRLAGYVSFYCNAFLKSHTLPRPDVVVTLTTPPLISLLGVWLRIVRRARFVYWVMDVYPDIAIRAGVLSRFNVLSYIWSFIAWLSYALANRVIVLGEDMKSVIARKHVRADKIDTIQCWSSSDEIFPIEPHKNHFRMRHMPDGIFSVMYSGNMGTCHSFDTVVEAIRRLKDREHVRFFFIGGGKQLPSLREKLRWESSVSFQPYQDRAELAHSLSAPSVHLICLNPTYDGLLVPSKVYGVMAAGRPALFVGSADNEIARIIREAECGMVVDPDDAEGLVAAIRHLSEHPEEAEEMGRRGRRYFERHFDRRIGTNRFATTLEHIGIEKGVRGRRTLAHPAAPGLLELTTATANSAQGKR